LSEKVGNQKSKHNFHFCKIKNQKMKIAFLICKNENEKSEFFSKFTGSQNEKKTREKMQNQWKFLCHLVLHDKDTLQKLSSLYESLLIDKTHSKLIDKMWEFFRDVIVAVGDDQKMQHDIIEEMLSLSSKTSLSTMIFDQVKWRAFAQRVGLLEKYSNFIEQCGLLVTLTPNADEKFFLCIQELSQQLQETYAKCSECCHPNKFGSQN
jgi:hypothetical protein